jgi:glucosamine--fructose-6-phosphate aminotransferase (isomerizing)
VDSVASPYLIDDIRAQAESLQRLLDHEPTPALRTFARERMLRDFDRIVITGMGGSLLSSYPTYLALARAGHAVWHIDTAELIREAPALITPRSLVWIVSQSGRTGEALTLIDMIALHRPFVLVTTNEPESPLAGAADLVVPLRAGAELVTSTKTTIATFAIGALLVAGALGGTEPSLAGAPAALAAYLEDADETIETIAGLVPEAGGTIVFGRGASYASALMGALTMKEAARVPAEGMTTGAFRHGPLELAGPGLRLIALAGQPATRESTARLAADSARLGSSVAWVGPDGPAEVAVLPSPALDGAARPIGEVVTIQLVTVALARRAGYEPGTFRHIEKVTTIE